MGMKLDISGLTAGYGSNHVIERLNVSDASENDGAYSQTLRGNRLP